MSCLLAFFLILFACFFHAGAFGSKTLFDPTMVPQWGTWLSMAVLPPFPAIGLMDSMTSSLPTTLTTPSISKYNWTMSDNLVGLDYLSKVSSTAMVCVDTESTHGEWNDVLDSCVYHQPTYGYIYLLVFVQNLILIPILELWYSYTVSEKGYRGLPSFFFAKREFWDKVKHLKPGKSSIHVKNLSVMFKQKKMKGKASDPIAQALGHHNVALKNVDFSLDEGQINALVAESNSGKTTTLAFMAGELNPMNMEKFVQKRKKALHCQLQIVEGDLHKRFFEAETPQ